MKLHPAVWYVPVILLLITLLPLPFGIYILMRLVVTVAAAFLAYAEYQRTGALSGWVITFILIAILFNPILPVVLPRILWIPINLAIAAVFAVHGSDRVEQFRMFLPYKK